MIVAPGPEAEVVLPPIIMLGLIRLLVIRITTTTTTIRTNTSMPAISTIIKEEIIIIATETGIGAEERAEIVIKEIEERAEIVVEIELIIGETEESPAEMVVDLIDHARNPESVLPIAVTKDLLIFPLVILTVLPVPLVLPRGGGSNLHHRNNMSMNPCFVNIYGKDQGIIQALLLVLVMVLIIILLIIIMMMINIKTTMVIIMMMMINNTTDNKTLS
jgi:hypothetical protein